MDDNVICAAKFGYRNSLLFEALEYPKEWNSNDPRMKKLFHLRVTCNNGSRLTIMKAVFCVSIPLFEYPWSWNSKFKVNKREHYIKRVNSLFCFSLAEAKFHLKK